MGRPLVRYDAAFGRRVGAGPLGCVCIPQSLISGYWVLGCIIIRVIGWAGRHVGMGGGSWGGPILHIGQVGSLLSCEVKR